MTFGELKDFKVNVKIMDNDALMKAYAKHLYDRSCVTRDWERKNVVFETEIRNRWGK